jgi:hypothetical protein
MEKSAGVRIERRIDEGFGAGVGRHSQKAISNGQYDMGRLFIAGHGLLASFYIFFLAEISKSWHLEISS